MVGWVLTKYQVRVSLVVAKYRVGVAPKYWVWVALCQNIDLGLVGLWQNDRLKLVGLWQNIKVWVGWFVTKYCVGVGWIVTKYWVGVVTR